jgi:nitrogen regulatory protein PII
MQRIEIIANQAVEEEIIELLAAAGYGESFTYTHPVYGRGESGRREGSPVWPETNSAFVVYADTEAGETILAGVQRVKSQFPNEGIKVWRIGFEE